MLFTTTPDSGGFFIKWLDGIPVISDCCVTNAQVFTQLSVNKKILAT
jgi:hypothetical protein